MILRAPDCPSFIGSPISGKKQKRRRRTCRSLKGLMEIKKLEPQEIGFGFRRCLGAFALVFVISECVQGRPFAVCLQFGAVTRIQVHCLRQVRVTELLLFTFFTCGRSYRYRHMDRIPRALSNKGISAKIETVEDRSSSVSKKWCSVEDSKTIVLQMLVKYFCGFTY